MTTHLDLDAEPINDEPSVVFRLNGRDWSCLSRDLIAAGDVENILSGRIRFEDFFNIVLVEEDREDFTKLLEKDSRAVSLTRYQRLSDELVSAVLLRPIVRSSSSTAGPQTTADTSKGASSSPATARRRRAS
jgi:hypothetical protein